MSWMMNVRGLSLICLTTIMIGLSGCGGNETASEPDSSQTPATTQVDDSHGGWWCVEHGVPEGECARCDKSLVSKFKEDGDWCDEHNRPESQCFICSPTRADKFIAQYEAKTGRKPPEPTE